MKQVNTYPDEFHCANVAWRFVINTEKIKKKMMKKRKKNKIKDDNLLVFCPYIFRSWIIKIVELPLCFLMRKFDKKKTKKCEKKFESVTLFINSCVWLINWDYFSYKTKNK